MNLYSNVMKFYKNIMKLYLVISLIYWTKESWSIENDSFIFVIFICINFISKINNFERKSKLLLNYKYERVKVKNYRCFIKKYILFVLGFIVTKVNFDICWNIKQFYFVKLFINIKYVFGLNQQWYRLHEYKNIKKK